MTSLSINLPDAIAKASNEAAKKIGISRTEFIRQAVVHELSNIQSQHEQERIITSFNSMKNSKNYLIETEIIEGLSSELPSESGIWWNKKKS